MNCADVRERLSALLDQALSPEEEGQVRAHLVSCESCRREHEDLAEMVRLIREAPADAAPEGFAESVLGALPPRLRVPRPLLWIAPLAAAACLLLVAWLFVAPEKAHGPDAAPAAEVASASHPADDSAPARSPRREPEEEGVGAGGLVAHELTAAKADRSWHGPAGEIPPGLREPSDPKPPEDLPPNSRNPGSGAVPGAAAPALPAPPAPPATPAAPAAEGPPREAPVRDEADDAERVDRKYLLRGMDPDTAAGVIYAELNLLRCRESRRRAVQESASARDRDEHLVADGDGAPSRLILDLTPEEVALLEDVFRERSRAQLLRTNGFAGRGGRALGEKDAAKGAGDAGASTGAAESRPDSGGGGEAAEPPSPGAAPPRLAEVRRTRVLIEFARR